MDYKCIFQILFSVIMFIPLRSKQHFIPFLDINQCILADICNHTWIPECGFYDNKTHHRLFLDECDMFEYNCDHNMFYKVTNYSDCFSPSAGCLTGPSLLTRVQNFYIYYANGRRVMYSYTTPKNPRKRTTYYTLPTTAQTRTTNWHERRRYTPQATGRYKPWSDDTTKRPGTHVVDIRETRLQYQLLLEPPPAQVVTKSSRRQTTKRTAKRTKPTTQILRTGTTGSVILKKMTVWKNGKMMLKVIKGYKTRMVKINDSEYLN